MKLALISVLVVSSLAACRSRRPDTVVIERNDASPPSTVVIEKDHTHGSTCGHYYHAGHWYYDANHVHIIE